MNNRYYIVEDNAGGLYAICVDHDAENYSCADLYGDYIIVDEVDYEKTFNYPECKIIAEVTSNGSLINGYPDDAGSCGLEFLENEFGIKPA